MPTGKITKRSVDALKHDPASVTPSGTIKDVYLWDDTLPGFGVKLTGSGSKVYLYQYRDTAGKTRRVTIGRHGKPWTPEKARTEAEGCAAQVRLAKDGRAKDPASVRADKRLNTESVKAAAEAFLQEHFQKKDRKASTKKEYERLFAHHVYPAIGSRSIESIDRASIARIHHNLRETPYQANRVLAALGSLFSWAQKNGIYEGANPCRLIEKNKERRRERFLSPLELAHLGNILAGHDTDAPVAAGAIRMLVLTGMRKNEVLRLRWDEVNREAAMIALADSKTGAKTIPLSAPVLEVLDSMANVRQRGNPYVFPGHKAGAYLVGLQKIWERWRDEATLSVWLDNASVTAIIDSLRGTLGRKPTPAEVREKATKDGIELPRGMDDVRIHDFRHSFASVGASAGDSLVILGSILGHTNATTTHRYAHLYDDPRKAAAERIAGTIAAGLAGTNGDIVDLPKRA